MPLYLSLEKKHQTTTTPPLQTEALFHPLAPERTLVRRDVVQFRDDESIWYVVEAVNLCSQDPPPPPPPPPPPCPLETQSSPSWWKLLFPHEVERFTSPRTLGGNVADPLYFMVFFDIKKERVADFIELIRQEAIQVHTKENETCLRFDLAQHTQDETKFVVLEVVNDWAAIEYHHAQEYYQTVREALWNIQATPRSHDGGCRVVYSDS